MKLLIATGNPGKFCEITQMLAGLPCEWVSLRDFPHLKLPEETGNSYAENAQAKAQSVAKQTGLWTLADDSGLEVEALKGQPGVRSARWAGEGATDRQNLEKLLQELRTFPQPRRAVFRCTLALASPQGELHFFGGELWGEIGLAPRGQDGFGYDPIFVLPEPGCSLAEISPREKNRLSHRAQAMDKLRRFLIPFFEKNH